MKDARYPERRAPAAQLTVIGDHAMMGTGESGSALDATPRLSVGWDAARRAQRVQVFGANGALGREMVRALLLAGHPLDHLRLFGREARTLRWYGTNLPVRPVRGPRETAELAFLCTPVDLSRQLAQALVGSGTRVLDLSGAHTFDSQVPLAAAGVQVLEVGAFTPLIGLPEPSAALLCPLLMALDRAVGLAHVQATMLRAVCSRGTQGILAWRRERSGEPPAQEEEVRLLGNYLSRAGKLDAYGNSTVELVVAGELRRLLRRPELTIDLTGVEVGVERVDGFALNLELRAELPPREARHALSSMPGVHVTEGEGPDPLSCMGSDEVHVGRIRAGSRGARSLCCFAVGDRLRTGAALQALRVASQLPSA
jgi:aspartate-semialdehyde dehydrogenase